jgi:hypothetical protein
MDTAEPAGQNPLVGHATHELMEDAKGEPLKVPEGQLSGTEVRVRQ